MQSVEAARECGMRAVVVAGRKPLYELGAADLVVKGLDELSFINLKQLFSNEEGVEGNVSSSCPCALPRRTSDKLLRTALMLSLPFKARLQCMQGSDLHSCSWNSICFTQMAIYTLCCLSAVFFCCLAEQKAGQ